ncbi:peroxiredoxin family protein [Roseateles sp. BYS87W]|uniref:Peroxiredoxin family protein n=1 Tax=Pelomonas baiyunensis TaxID=3299026 RepID=A0ABW7H1C0_9BURK
MRSPLLNLDPAHRAPLPEWDVDGWLNTRQPLTLAALRGRVVLLHAFQMLCPGCVSQGLPQAERVRQAFPVAELAVVGLHTVFEHHAAMSPDALRAFVHEYRWSFPIGVDRPDGRGGPSRTMTRYGLRGTPSCVVLDRQGRVCLQHFGALDDLLLGAVLGQLIAEPAPGTAAVTAAALRPAAGTPPQPVPASCSDGACTWEPQP